MRILFVITKSEIGGAQRFVAEQIQILKQEGHHNVYLATNQVGWLTDVSSVHLTDVCTDKRITRLFHIRYIFHLITYFRRHEIDLVVCNSANGGFYGRLAAYFTNTKSIYVSHGWSSIYNGGWFSFLFNRIEQVLGYLCASVLCVSSTDFEKARHVIGLPPTKLHLLPNSIFPITRAVPLPERQSAIYSILTICRLTVPKRVDLLIEAVKALPFVNLFIIGTGPQMNALQSQVAPDFAHKIQFLGEIPAFQNFNAYDAFALISDSEGLPISALEAMSCGLPLIVSDVGGCRELIDKNGALVDNTVDSVRNGINACIKNHTHYAKASSVLFDSRYNLTKKSHAYLEYYQTIAKRTS